MLIVTNQVLTFDILNDISSLHANDRIISATQHFQASRGEANIHNDTPCILSSIM
jgi:hypothetical protein